MSKYLQTVLAQAAHIEFSLPCTMPWTAAPPTPRCPACSTPVFANEAYMAADRTPFHKTCIKCGLCRKPLSPADINEHEKQLFCRVCYESSLAPKVGQAATVSVYTCHVFRLIMIRIQRRCKFCQFGEFLKW